MSRHLQFKQNKERKRKNKVLETRRKLELEEALISTNSFRPHQKDTDGHFPIYSSPLTRHRYAKTILKAELQPAMSVIVPKIKEGIIYQGASFFAKPVMLPWEQLLKL